jgi:hypothetical protein
VLGGLQVASPNGKCESMDGFRGYANVDAVHRRRREWNRIMAVCRSSMWHLRSRGLSNRTSSAHSRTILDRASLR